MYSGQFLTFHLSKSRTGLIVSKLTLTSNFTVHAVENWFIRNLYFEEHAFYVLSYEL